jgi:RNA polymerase sigma-70 factor (ECF subfamily)
MTADRPPPDTPPDLRPLVAAWLAHGDEEAARALIDKLYPQVIRIVQNHLPRGVDPGELAHEVFVQFFRTLDRYDSTRPLEPWLSRLAVNVCLNALRARRRRPEYRWADLTEDERRAVEAVLAHPDLESAAPQAESRQLLERLLAALAPADRLVITLLHLEERPVAEIAELTGWSRVVVRMRAYRARRRLRRLLLKLGPDRPH